VKNVNQNPIVQTHKKPGSPSYIFSESFGEGEEICTKNDGFMNKVCTKPNFMARYTKHIHDFFSIEQRIILAFASSFL
jgi:hypothetical protein